MNTIETLKDSLRKVIASLTKVDRLHLGSDKDLKMDLIWSSIFELQLIPSETEVVIKNDYGIFGVRLRQFIYVNQLEDVSIQVLLASTSLGEHSFIILNTNISD